MGGSTSKPSAPGANGSTASMMPNLNKLNPFSTAPGANGSAPAPAPAPTPAINGVSTRMNGGKRRRTRRKSYRKRR